MILLIYLKIKPMKIVLDSEESKSILIRNAYKLKIHLLIK